MPNDAISLRQPTSSGTGEDELQDTEQDPSNNPDQASTRQWESGRKKAGVLVGSSILQLPIWGFAMSYGVFQEYYSNNWTLQGAKETTGIIGTTSNGVMYLSMPFLFALFTRRWAQKRQTAALGGAALMCLSFMLSSFSTNVWHLIATQGVMAALGCALIFSPTTLSLGEWFNTSNRAVAYGVTLSCKNIVGSTCPFLFRLLLSRYGFRTALRAYSALAVGTSILAIFLIPTHPSKLTPSTTTPGTSTSTNPTPPRARKIPWHFLHHRTFYIHALAITLQSSGYGIPQTYLNTYAHEIALLSQTSATLLLTLFNIPGIASSSFFGYLCNDNKNLTSIPHRRSRFLPRPSLSATTVTTLSSGCSALSALLLWGLTPNPHNSPHTNDNSNSHLSMALLILFSLTFGFFAGGYSATWGGVINEMEGEAARRNEAIDSGMVYGLLNGARGVGYVGGGVVGVPLLKAGTLGAGVGRFGYGTRYGPLIVFTGLMAGGGGWGVLWKLKWRGWGWGRRLRVRMTTA